MIEDFSWLRSVWVLQQEHERSESGDLGVTVAAVTRLASARLTKEVVELVVSANPDPGDDLASAMADCTQIETYSHRPEIGMSREFFERE